MSDDAHFLLSGHVNKPDSRLRRTQNPQLNDETSSLPLETTDQGVLFLMEFLKSKVYVTKPQTIQHIKDNISHEIEEIQPQMLQDVMKNALKRAESCIANRCYHLADITCKS
ncbi:hypothetical protein GWI33_003058 [Rhynchophorus ferrugineus]|uniref:Uncharacterized protein n=1 Tax=Rhynchophorus ferrugineus TaxID=354439 RepID=A0A834HXD6_RHYFE|nr:hypothetical protein GWI33_003058 [Rhynchophorus ferrugineus]